MGNCLWGDWVCWTAATCALELGREFIGILEID